MYRCSSTLKICQTTSMRYKWYFVFSDNMDIPPPQPDFSAPPPYDVAANSKLPTYEEVQREKQMEGEGPPPVSLYFVA